MSQSCSDLFSLDSEMTAIQSFKDNSISATEACVLSSIDKNWLDLANTLTTNALDNEVKLSDAIATKSAEKRAKIEKIIKTFENRPISSEQSPAFQWAQSPNKIFMEVVFSNKIDSPPCISFKDEKVEFEDRRVKFSGLCHVANVKITYSLDLALYDEIDTELSSWSRTTQGRATITLTKKTAPSAWPRLMQGKKLPNQSVWWEIKEKYKSQMNNLIGDESGFVDEEDMKSEL